MAASRGRLLVVDDDRAVRESMQHWLGDHGYEVQTAADGREALALLKEGQKPDAIIIDLMMPVMSGWEFLESKAMDDGIRSVPVLVLTAFDHDPVSLKHVVGVYRKPVDPASFLETLDRHLQKR